MSITEHISVSDPEFERIENLVLKSYPKSCICTIEKVNNPRILDAFNKFKSSHECEIWELFHGTHSQNISNIIQTGFQASRNVTSAYGKGTYFAKNAHYSFNYMKNNHSNDLSYMFLADVAIHDLGNVTLHNENKSIIVATNDDQIYPKYIIGFHKTAN